MAVKKLTLSASVFRFECTGCGRCCEGRGRYMVEASREEQRRIQRFLKISWRWFRRRYVDVYVDGSEGLRWAVDRCSFLDTQRRCRIYSVRPAQCRTYPFWDEVAASPASWKREAASCEGIGRGAVIPLRDVQQRLRASRKPVKLPQSRRAAPA